MPQGVSNFTRFLREDNFFVTPSILQGTTTNDNAVAGNVGEYISSTVATGSAVPAVSGTVQNITSISLTAGDWDVWGDLNFNAAATTQLSVLNASISTVNGTTANNIAGQFASIGSLPLNSGGSPITLKVGAFRLSLAVTTTVFLNMSTSFGTSTLAGWGILQARRRR